MSREELRKAKDIAEASSRMKTTFIQSMTHEIRTPLNSIVGFSQVLSDHYSNSPETQEFVNIIKSNSNDLLRLVTDVLALSELDQYEQLPTDDETDMNTICQLASEVAKDNRQKDVEVLFEPAKENLLIRSNSERISQVLNNLAHNAAKFTTHGSIRIAYSVLEAEKKIEISVTDTGTGIPKDQQEAVFERFYKMEFFHTGHRSRTADMPEHCREVRRQPPDRLFLYGRMPDDTDSSFGICLSKNLSELPSNPKE